MCASFPLTFKFEKLSMVYVISYLFVFEFSNTGLSNKFYINIKDTRFSCDELKSLLKNIMGSYIKTLDSIDLF